MEVGPHLYSAPRSQAMSRHLGKACHPTGCTSPQPPSPTHHHPPTITHPPPRHDHRWHCRSSSSSWPREWKSSWTGDVSSLKPQNTRGCWPSNAGRDVSHRVARLQSVVRLPARGLLANDRRERRSRPIEEREAALLLQTLLPVALAILTLTELMCTVYCV